MTLCGVWCSNQGRPVAAAGPVSKVCSALLNFEFETCKHRFCATAAFFYLSSFLLY